MFFDAFGHHYQLLLFSYVSFQCSGTDDLSKVSRKKKERRDERDESQDSSSKIPEDQSKK
jgi:hypothetical protein